MAQIIDLDELLGDDKKVKLKGVVYVLPPDLPVELYLRITKLAQSEQAEQDMVEALYDELLELFRYKNPKLASLPLSMSQLVTLIARVYGAPDEEEAARPPRRSRSGGATSSKTKARTRPRR